MRLSRKTLHPWIEEHIGPVRDAHHAELASGFIADAPAGRIGIFAINKRAALYDYTIKRQRNETGVNVKIWAQICRTKTPCRLVICHKGRVYMHSAKDVRTSTPEERYVHGQRDHDPKGVAWWPWAEWLDVTGGLPGAPVEPTVAAKKDAEAGPKTDATPSILDLFNPEGEDE